MESEAQKEKMEKITASELKVLTNDIRTKVILKERELEEITARLEEAKSKRKSVCTDLKYNLRKYERKYDKLQIKRQRDLKEINGELKSLRDMIANLEEKLKDNKDKENITVDTNVFNKSLTLATVTASKEIKNKIKAIANKEKGTIKTITKPKLPLRPKSAPTSGWKTVTTPKKF
jgi:CRISPR/Cas system CMR-associated protein Cmr1 (group 7 of RAMP superfamily)